MDPRAPWGEPGRRLPCFPPRSPNPEESMKARALMPLALSLAALALGGTSASAAFKAGATAPKAGPFGDVMASRNCATPEPPMSEQLQVMTAVRRYVEESQTLAVGGQIKVAFHVIYTAGEG